MTGKQFSASVVLEGVDNATGPIRNVIRSLEGLTKVEAFSRLGNAWANVGNKMNTVNREVGLLATRFAGLGVASVGLFSAFIKPASELENLRYRLDKVSESTIKGGEAFDKITKFAVKSPYSFNALADSFANLKAQGLDSFKSFESIENYLGAMVPDSFRASNAVDALAKAWGRGKLQAREGNQLISAGVPIYKLLGEVLGKTRTQIDKMSKSGLINHDVLNKVFDLMQKKSLLGGNGVGDLFSTKLSNLGDAWDLFAYKVMNTKLGDISLFGQIKDDMGKLQDFMNKGFSGAAGKQVAQTLSEIYSVGKDLARAFLEITPVVLSAWNAFKQFTGGTKNAIYTIGAFIALPAVASIVNLGVAIAGVATTFVGWIGTLDVAWAALGVGIAVFEALTNPIVWVVGGIAVLAAGAALIANNWGAISGWFAEMWQKWGGLIREIFPEIAFVVDAAESIMQNWKPISDFFSALWGTLGEGFTQFGQMVMDIFEPIGDFFKWFGSTLEGIAVKLPNNNQFTGQKSWQPSPGWSMPRGDMAPPIRIRPGSSYGYGASGSGKKDNLQVALKVDVVNNRASVTNVQNFGDSNMHFLADMGFINL